MLCNTNAPYGGVGNMPGNFADTTTSSTSSTITPQSLAEDFLLLLTNFRGGNHPYLEKYKAHLRALHILDDKIPDWLLS